MECKKCKKECMENELVNGFCSDCIKKYGDSTSSNPTQNIHFTNKVSEKIKKIIYITWILGIIFSLIVSFAIYNTNKNGFTAIVTFITLFSIIFCSTLLLEGLAEIIQLLEDIKNK